MQPLDEMDLSLILPRSGGFDGPPFPGESHIPALILGILEGCVIVLQYNLSEDTIFAPAIWLCEKTERFLVLHLDKNCSDSSIYKIIAGTHGINGFIQCQKNPA